MSDVHPLMTVAILNLAAAVSPGPAFALVTQTAASSKRGVAWATAAGTVAASLIWATTALLGWQFVLARAAAIYRFLLIAGGLYLCFIGWATWRHAPDALPEAAGGDSAPLVGFRKGLLLGLSNPKVIVFFGTIFTTLFGPSTPEGFRWAALLVVLINEGVWYGALATLFGTLAARRLYRRIKVHAERFFGGLLVFFGVRLVWSGCRNG